MRLFVGKMLKHGRDRNRNYELHDCVVRIVVLEEQNCSWQVITAGPNTCPGSYFEAGRIYTEHVAKIPRYFGPTDESLFAKPRLP